jgi:hypothetical protein
MTPTPKATSRPSASISYVMPAPHGFYPASPHPSPPLLFIDQEEADSRGILENPNHRTRRQDCQTPDCDYIHPLPFRTFYKIDGEANSEVIFSSSSSVGHSRPGAIPHHHLILLPRRPRHLRRLRRHGHGFLQQRQAVAAGDRSLRDRGRQ